MAKTVINYQKGRRDFLEELYNHGIFGLSSQIDNKNQAIFIASLGVNDPQELTSRDDGWVRCEYIKSASEKAMVSCPLLGTAKTDQEFEEYSEFDACIGYFEKCAEKGFQEIKQMANEANWDNNILERRMMVKLDLLYTDVVENNI